MEVSGEFELARCTKKNMADNDGAGGPTARPERGRLRIYLGSAAGVGKTYAMLSEGHRRAERGADVVVGFAEAHERPQTSALLAGLEVVPRATLEYRGGTFEEMDLDGVLARRPEIALVDEFAHTNVPGSRNEKRWQDVEVDYDRRRYRVERKIQGAWEARERVVVALTGGPEGKTLIRQAARIAARSAGGDLLAVHVTKSDGLTGADPAALAAQRQLVESVGGTYHQVVGDDISEALLTFARAENATQLVLGASRRSWLTAMLTGPGISARTIRGSGDIDVHIVTHGQMGRGRGLPRPRGAITRRRKVAGYVLAAALLPVLTVLLAAVRGGVNLTSDVLMYLTAVILVALTGGF